MRAKGKPSFLYASVLMSAQRPQLWTLSQEGMVAAEGRGWRSGSYDPEAAARRTSLKESSGWIASLGPQRRAGVKRHSCPLVCLDVLKPPSF